MSCSQLQDSQGMRNTISLLGTVNCGWYMYMSTFKGRDYFWDVTLWTKLNDIISTSSCKLGNEPLSSHLCAKEALHSNGESTSWSYLSSIKPMGARLTEVLTIEPATNLTTPSSSSPSTWTSCLLALGAALKDNMLQVVQAQTDLMTTTDVTQIATIVNTSSFLLPKLGVPGTCLLLASLGNYKPLEELWQLSPNHGPNLTIPLVMERDAGSPLHSVAEVYPLALAVILDDFRLAEYLVKRGSNPNCLSETFYSALQLAVFMQREKMVKMFVKACPVETVCCHPLIIAVCMSSKDVLSALLSNKTLSHNLNFTDSLIACSPLMAALVCGNLPKVKLLTKKKMDYNLSDFAGYTAIYFAIYGDSLLACSCCNMTKHILYCSPESVHHSSARNTSPLHIAAFLGLIEACKMLLKKGAPFEKTDMIERHVLHWAVMNSEMACLEHLLTYPNSAPLLNSGDAWGATPLHYAALLGRKEHINLLVRKGTKVDVPCNLDNTPLVWAICGQHLQSVKTLVSLGAAISPAPSVRQQQDVLALEDQSIPFLPLLAAARSGSVDIVQFLLDMGAKVNERGSDGSTALHHSSVMGHTACLEALLQAGAHVDAFTELKETSLHLAAAHGHGEAVRVLLKAGASPSISHPNQSNSVAHLSSMHGKEDCLHVLMNEGGCDPNTTRPSDHWTPLHVAASRGHLKCMDCLLQRGAYVNAIDSSSNKSTPLDVALKEGHSSATTVLIQAGGRTNGGTHHRAASLIQAVWRFHVHMRRKCIGSAWAANRVKSAAKKVALKKKATRLRIVRERERNSAALIIQKHWRQYIAKKRRYEATVNQLRSKIKSEKAGYGIIIRELRKQCMAVKLPSCKSPASSISSKALLKGPISPPFPDCHNKRKQPVAKRLNDTGSVQPTKKSGLKKNNGSKKDSKSSKAVKLDCPTFTFKSQRKETDTKQSGHQISDSTQEQKLPDVPKGRTSVVSPSSSVEKTSAKSHTLTAQTKTTVPQSSSNKGNQVGSRKTPVKPTHSGSTPACQSYGSEPVSESQDTKEVLKSLTLLTVELPTLDYLPDTNANKKLLVSIRDQYMQLRQLLGSMDEVQDAEARRPMIMKFLEEGIRLRAEMDSVADSSV